MTARGLLRIVLLLALVPLVLRPRGRFASLDDEEDESDLQLDHADADDEDEDGLTDINTASRAALAALPGIGPARADDIVRNRPYRAKLDLLRRGIISEATYRSIRDQVIARHRQFEPTDAEISPETA